MIAEPDATPVTKPPELTEAIAALLVVHEPPAIASESSDELPGQTIVVPVITPGSGNVEMVTNVVAAATPQVVVTVYEIIDVPFATPVTTPDVLIVATDVVTLLHTPPVTRSVSVVVEPGHVVVVPEIVPASGSGSTVIIIVSYTVPQVLVTE
jgi:hypothetical protein